MTFPLPFPAQLIFIIQVQLFAQHEKAGNHVLRDRKAVGSGGIGQHRSLRKEARFAIAFRSRVVQLDPLQIMRPARLGRIVQISQNHIRIGKKLLRNFTFQSENGLFRPRRFHNAFLLFLRKRGSHYNLHLYLQAFLRLFLKPSGPRPLQFTAYSSVCRAPP